jgi:hypothetical protein
MTMSKRAIYSIPLAGLALTSIGCPGEEPPPPVVDELANATFQVDVFNGFPTPAVYAGTDVSAAQDGSLLCDVTYDHSDVTFAANLTGTIAYSAPEYVNCVDAAGAPADPALIPADVIVNFDVTAVAVVVNSTYTITLQDDQGGAPIELDCTLDAGNLDCGDGAFLFTEN